MAETDPRISVVIPVYNSRSTIEKCLHSLMNQDHPSYEVIVVDDGSSDGTDDLCRECTGVRVIKLGRSGPSLARNVGVSEARGRLIAFTDGDCILPSNWLRELESCFTADDIAGGGGDQKSPEDDTAFGKLIQDYLKSVGFITGYIKNEETLRETAHNPSCNAIYRREILERVGGFEPALWPGEDVDLDAKITGCGYRLMYNPAACVSHYRPQNLRSFARMMYRYGACQWPLFRRYGFFRPILFEPVALVAGILAVVLLLVFKPAWWPIILLPFVAAFAWFLLRSKSVVRASRFFGLFLVTLVFWNAGFFTGFRYKPVAV